MHEQESSPEPELVRPDPTDRNATSIDRLLDAVVCLVVEEGTQLLAASLRPDAVTERAGKSRASYYRTSGFAGSRTDLVDPRRAVLVDALSRCLHGSAHELEQMVGGVARHLQGDEREAVPVALIRALAEENFDLTVRDAYFYVQLLGAGLSPSAPEFAEAIRRYYDDVASVYDELWRSLLDHWGYAARPPLGYRDLTILLSALGEGLGLRRVGDPTIDGRYYADVLAIVLPAVLVRRDRRPTEPAVELGEAVPIGPQPTTRSSIVSAALRLFRPGHPHVPSVDDIATEAECSAMTVVAAFGGVPGVVLAAWEEWAPEFVHSLEVDRRGSRPDPLTQLYRLATRVAERALDQRRLVRALMITELSAPDQTSGDTVAKLFESLLAEAVESGGFAPPGRGSVEARTRSFARLLRRSLLIAVVDHVAVSTDPDDHARTLVDEVWSVFMPAHGHA